MLCACWTATQHHQVCCIRSLSLCSRTQHTQRMRQRVGSVGWRDRGCAWSPAEVFPSVTQVYVGCGCSQAAVYVCSCAACVAAKCTRACAYDLLPLLFHAQDTHTIVKGGPWVKGAGFWLAGWLGFLQGWVPSSPTAVPCICLARCVSPACACNRCSSRDVPLLYGLLLLALLCLLLSALVAHSVLSTLLHACTHVWPGLLLLVCSLRTVVRSGCISLGFWEEWSDGRVAVHAGVAGRVALAAANRRWPAHLLLRRAF